MGVYVRTPVLQKCKNILKVSVVCVSMCVHEFGSLRMFSDNTCCECMCVSMRTCVCAPECLYVGDCVIFYMFVSTWHHHVAPAEFTWCFVACVCMLMHTLGIMILPESSHAVSHYALILSHGALQPSRVQCLFGGRGGQLGNYWI